MLNSWIVSIVTMYGHSVILKMILQVQLKVLNLVMKTS